MSKLTVTYIKHSGFLIETANSYLLFDYWQGKLPELQYEEPELLAIGKKTIDSWFTQNMDMQLYKRYF